MTLLPLENESLLLAWTAIHDTSYTTPPGGYTEHSYLARSRAGAPWSEAVPLPDRKGELVRLLPLFGGDYLLSKPAMTLARVNPDLSLETPIGLDIWSPKAGETLDAIARGADTLLVAYSVVMPTRAGALRQFVCLGTWSRRGKLLATEVLTSFQAPLPQDLSVRIAILEGTVVICAAHFDSTRAARVANGSGELSPWTRAVSLIVKDSRGTWRATDLPRQTQESPYGFDVACVAKELWIAQTFSDGILLSRYSPMHRLETLPISPRSSAAPALTANVPKVRLAVQKSGQALAAWLAVDESEGPGPREALFRILAGGGNPDPYQVWIRAMDDTTDSTVAPATWPAPDVLPSAQNNSAVASAPLSDGFVVAAAGIASERTAPVRYSEIRCTRVELNLPRGK